MLVPETGAASSGTVGLALGWMKWKSLSAPCERDLSSPVESQEISSTSASALNTWCPCATVEFLVDLCLLWAVEFPAPAAPKGRSVGEATAGSGCAAPGESAGSVSPW